MPDPRHTPTLVEWLTARLDEDEARARAAIEDDGGSGEGFANQYAYLTNPTLPLGFVPSFAHDAAIMITTYAVPDRVLADVAAKRRIVETLSLIAADPSLPSSDTADWVLLQLVSVYRDAPGYRTEWDS